MNGCKFLASNETPFEETKGNAQEEPSINLPNREEKTMARATHCKRGGTDADSGQSKARRTNGEEKAIELPPETIKETLTVKLTGMETTGVAMNKSPGTEPNPLKDEPIEDAPEEDDSPTDYYKHKFVHNRRKTKEAMNNYENPWFIDEHMKIKSTP